MSNKSHPKVGGTVAKGYCERFPKTPVLTIAKKMYAENPELFTSLEAARNVIRYYRGSSGDRNRKKAIKEFQKPLMYKYNPFDLPESHAEKAKVFNLPTGIKKVLLISDLHIPYHDIDAITAAIEDGKKENVDCIFLNGDALDFFQLSFHEKDPRKTSIPEEIKAGKAFFKSLRSAFPKATIYYIPANHENRLQRYLRVKAPELLDMEEFRLDILLDCRTHNIIYLDYGSKVYFGKLLVEHGDKMRGAGGVNPARTLALKIKRHAICGHFHRTSENISKVYDGDSIVTYSTGCLCELEPEYMQINEHNHGFAIIEMLGSGGFSVRNKKIVKGKVY